MRKLLLRPNRDSYSVDDGQTFLQTRLEGGASRFRRSFLGAARLVNVSWTLRKCQYEYLTSFYNTILEDGSQPFKIDLILDSSRLTEHTAHFVDEPKRLEGQNGLSYTVSAQLEVLPKRTNPDLDEAKVNAFEADPNADICNVEVNYPKSEVPIDLAIQAFAFNFPWIAEDGVTVIDQTGQGRHGTLVGTPEEIAEFVESGILGLSPQFNVGISGIVGYTGVYTHGATLETPFNSTIIPQRRTHSIWVLVEDGIGVMQIGTDFEVR